MHKRKAMLLAPLAIAGVVLPIVSGGAASAAGANGGPVNLYEADTSHAGNLGTVILTGAITDVGTDQQGNPQDGTNRLILSKGSFSINVNDLGNKLASLPVVPSRDSTTCSLDGTATPTTVTIVAGSGTGAYTGISGSFKATGATAAIVPRLSNGQCDTSAPGWGILTANGSGTVTLP